MNATELRELDAWIAEHVMNHVRTENPDDYTESDKPLFWHRPESEKQKEIVLVSAPYFHKSLGRFAHSWNLFQPTTDPAAAMDVLKKCCEIGVLNGEFKVPVSIRRRGDLRWVISESAEDQESDTMRHFIVVEAETIELAIALFAKQLFTK